MSGVGSSLAVLRAPGVARLFSASLASRFPAAAMGVLFVLQARDLNHSYAEGGAVAALFAIGTAVGAPTLGRLIDTRGQTVVLCISALVCSLALVGVALMDAGAPVPLIAALAFVSGVMQPPIAAAARAVWAKLFDTAGMHAVLALEASLQEIAFMLGPIILVTLVAAGEPARGLIGAAAMVFVSTVVYALGPEPRSIKGTGRRPRKRGGAMRVPGVRTLFLLAITLGFSFGAIEVGIAAFAEHEGHAGATGVLLACWGIGSLAAGLFIVRRGPAKNPVREMVGLHFVLTLFNVLLVTAPGLIGLGALLVVAGAAIAPMFAVLYRLLAEVADEESITEAYSWELTGITAGVALGVAVGGALASGPGPREAFIAGGAATLIGAIAGRLRANTLYAKPAPAA
jgi:MFS family permease